MGDRLVGALSVALAAGLLRLAAACSEEGPGPCTPDSSLVIVVDPAEVHRVATVTTEGACTTLECVAPVDGGCREWRGEMTSTDESTSCRVYVTRPDGVTSLLRDFPSSMGCDGPFGWAEAIGRRPDTYDAAAYEGGGS